MMNYHSMGHEAEAWVCEVLGWDRDEREGKGGMAIAGELRVGT